MYLTPDIRQAVTLLQFKVVNPAALAASTDIWYIKVRKHQFRMIRVPIPICNTISVSTVT